MKSMEKIVRVQLNGIDVLLVNVKKSAFGFRINWKMLGFTERGKGGYNWVEIELPDKRFKVVGKPNEINESEAAKIVEWKIIEGKLRAIRYKCYQYGSFKYFTALTSLDSLLRSHDLQPETTVILIK